MKTINNAKRQKSKAKSKLLLASIFLTLYFMNFTNFQLLANNLLIDSVSLINGGADVRFLISWNNSWRVDAPTPEPNNWDAVWAFVKFATCDSTDWAHADVSTVGGNHSMDAANPSDLDIETVTDGKGVFIRRNSPGGPANIAQISCTLRLAIPGPPASYNIKVIGIEMAWVPTGAFYLGDLGSNKTYSTTFYSSTGNDGKIDAWRQANGFLGVARDTLGRTGQTDVTSSTIPAAFPMGYNGFYCMKYEISQGQYVDFLNSLTYDQQATRTVIAPNTPANNWACGVNSSTTGRSRNYIKLKTSGLIWSPTEKTPAVYGCDGDGDNNYNESNDGENVAMNYMNWADFAAYMDWAALRPMTDMEFEKASRGTIGRVDYEYVWGLNWNLGGNVTQAYAGYAQCGSNCAAAPSTILNYGQANELFNGTGNGLAAYGYSTESFVGFPCTPPSTGCTWGNGNTCNRTWSSSVPGPLRVGFAATATTDRATSGATFYGIMDMGGNMWERVVNPDTQGRTYTGVLGDGNLDASGNANVTNWLSNSVALNGGGLRGGSWYDIKDYMRTSDRVNSYYGSNTTRGCTAGGGRGVR